jgi:hypothetical protein
MCHRSSNNCGATGELIVLRLLEAMMAGEIIDAGDIQKAIEHIL